jgi:hypothetical protein
MGGTMSKKIIKVNDCLYRMTKYGLEYNSKYQTGEDEWGEVEYFDDITIGDLKKLEEAFGEIDYTNKCL